MIKAVVILQPQSSNHCRPKLGHPTTGKPGGGGVASPSNAGTGVETEYLEATPRKVCVDKGVGTKTTPVIIRAMTRRMTNNCFLTTNGVCEKVPGLSSVSTRRVNQDLKRLGFKSGVAVKKPFLTEAQKDRRIRWAISRS